MTKSKILITGTRAPYAIELAHRFVSSGHEVITADSTCLRLCKNLSWIKKSYKIKSPNNNLKQFAATINKIIIDEKIDYIIPTCEETYYLSFIKAKLKAILLSDNFSIMRKLHSKELFIDLVSDVWQHHPKTVSFEKFNNDFLNFVVKKKFSCFGNDVYFSSKKIPSISLTDREKFIAQEYIDGDEVSCYIICVNGVVTGISSYKQVVKFKNGASITFQAIEYDLIKQFVTRFSALYNLSGQFSFDFIKKKTGELVPIECNPRSTSGLHLLDYRADMLSLFIDKKHKNSVIVDIPNKTKGLKLVHNILGARFPKHAEDVFTDYGSNTLTFNQLISIAGFALKAIFKQNSITQAMVDDIQWNGDLIE